LKLKTDWYDYGARMYDPQIGRWNAVDPVIEEHYDYTGYAYTYNNPLRYWDYFGLDSIDAVALTEAIGYAVNKIIEDFGNNSAQCSRGVQILFQNLTGSNEFEGMNANDMFVHMLFSENFEVITQDDMQEVVNDGGIVIPGKMEDGSGHVVVGSPGEEDYSTTWGENVPKVMDTGEEKRYTNERISGSWVSKDKPGITYFRYMGDTYTSRTYSGGSLGQIEISGSSGTNNKKTAIPFSLPGLNTLKLK